MYRAAGYLQGQGRMGDYVELEQFRDVPGFGFGLGSTAVPQAPFESVLLFAATLASQSPTEARLAAVVSAIGNTTPAQLGTAEQLGCALVRNIRQGADGLSAVRTAVAAAEKQLSLQETQLRSLLAVIAVTDPSRTGNYEASALKLLLMNVTSPSSTVLTNAKNALAKAIAVARAKSASPGRAAQMAFAMAQPTLFATKKPLVLTAGYRCDYGLTPAQQAEAAKTVAILAAREQAVRDAQAAAAAAAAAASAPAPAPAPAPMTETLTEQGTVLSLPAPSSAADMTLEQLLAQPAPAPAPAPLVYTPPQPDNSWSSQVPQTTAAPTMTVEENWAYPSDASLPALPPVLTQSATSPAVWQPPEQVVLDLPAPATEAKPFPVVPVALAAGGVVAAILLYRKFGTKK